MGGWDEQALNEVLGDIAKQDFGLAQITGTSAHVLDAIIDAQEAALAEAVRASDTTAGAAEPAHEGHVHAGPFAFADPQAEAPWMQQTAPRYDEPIEHVGVPATGARYAETPEAEAQRTQRVASYEPRVRHDTGLVEMILVYSIDDRNEAARLIGAARHVLGGDLKGAEVILRALRVLTAVLDAAPAGGTVDMSKIAAQAGWSPADAL
jgi:hypothetical protein